MKRISHKQAAKLIDRRLDGLLTEKQAFALDKHLASCEACRLYAAEIESLPAQLQNEFHDRWDEKAGPSQRVLEHIAVKARRIPVSNRFSSNVRLLAGTIALIVLAFVINFVVSHLQHISPAATNGTPTFISPAQFKIDPQSCGPAEPASSFHALSGLYGKKPIQGITLTDGAFSYDFWLYCDPELKPDKEKQLNTIAGLGLLAAWQYDGPKIEGAVEYHYEFEPNIVFGETSWNGPLYRGSATDAKFGIDIPPTEIQAAIQQGTPIRFHTVVDLPLGHKEAIFSFRLAPTGQGLKIANLHAEAGPLTSAQDRLIAFVSAQTGNTDIYTMHADGSGVTNLTNDPAQDTVPVWSPDGTRIAFVSDRDGNFEIYVMNADGSGLTRLTNDPAIDVMPRWSPDSTKIAYTSRNDDKSISSIYLVDSNGQHRRRLTDDVSSGLVASPEAWSPDGQVLFFHSDGQIRKVNISSGIITSVTPIEDMPSQDVLIRDDSKLLYLETCGQNAAEFCTQIKSISQDGTGEEALAPLELQDICWSKGTIRYEMIKWSPDRTKILFSFYCKDKDGLFYIANADGSDFKPLTSYPILHEAGGFDWSPDSQSIIFSTLLGNEKTDRPYLLNINSALQSPDVRPSPLNISVSQISFFAWQPAADKIVQETPVPTATSQPPEQTTNRSLAFASAMQGHNIEIYTMRPDGSELKNITNDPAHDINPFWSPDGRRIAFESDRRGFTQIYVMNADGSNVVQVTGGEIEHHFRNSSPWSPDGNKLLFTEKASADRWALYSIDIDGQNKTFLAQVPDIYSVPSWSPDGAHIAFIAREPQGDRALARIHVVDAGGGNPTDATKRLPADEDLISWEYDWSPNGQFISFIAARTAYETNSGQASRYTAYEASLDGETLTEKATSSTPMDSWWNGTAFIPGFYPSTLTWLHSDGTYNTFQPLLNCHMTNNSSAGFLTKRSVNGNLIFNVNCPNDELWFYWANADGTEVKPLFDFPILARGGGINGIVWSLYDKYATITLTSSGINYLYVIDIQAALQDPSRQPVQMALYGDVMSSNVSWQPLP